MKAKSKQEVKNLDTSDEKKMTRKEALKKTGYVALSAATMMLLLSSPAKGQTSSPAYPPNGVF